MKLPGLGILRYKESGILSRILIVLGVVMLLIVASGQVGSTLAIVYVIFGILLLVVGLCLFKNSRISN